MKGFRPLSAMLQAEMTSAELELILQMVGKAGIAITYIQYQDPLTCRFWVRRKDYSALQTICESRGTALRICGRKGIYWAAKAIVHRPVFSVGLIVFFVITLLLPGRILFVQVEGNQTISAKIILEAAEDSGIAFGASRKDVRSEKSKNALLKAIPKLQWAGVNTYGCTAVISVRERSGEPEVEPKHVVSHIVACRDGYILSGTVTQGTGRFKIGDAVKEGEILISGYTDCGLSIRAEQASGEVFAQTNRSLESVADAECRIRTEEKKTKRKFSLLIRKKRINLWKDSGISDSTCVRIYEEYYVTLPGGLILPFALCVETYTQFETQTETITIPDTELHAFSERYIVQQMSAGKITDRSCVITNEKNVYRFSGSFTCVEMIGREQIGDKNGKTD